MDIVRYIPDYNINRFHLEYGGGRSRVRATVALAETRPFQVTLEIRTSDPEIMEACESEYDNKDSPFNENRRAIVPLREAFGPRFEAGGRDWKDTDESDLVYDSL